MRHWRVMGFTQICLQNALKKDARSTALKLDLRARASVSLVVDGDMCRNVTNTVACHRHVRVVSDHFYVTEEAWVRVQLVVWYGRCL